jgi:hypothetical protein
MLQNTDNIDCGANYVTPALLLGTRRIGFGTGGIRNSESDCNARRIGLVLVGTNVTGALSGRYRRRSQRPNVRGL